MEKKGKMKSIFPGGAPIFPKKCITYTSCYSETPAALRDAGIFYATEQIMDLLENGVDGIHLYTMNNVEVSQRISSSIESIIAAKNAAR